MSRRGHDEDSLRCSFCRKSQESVRNLISSPIDAPSSAYICDECILVCASILQDDSGLNAAIGLPIAKSFEQTELLNHPAAPELLAAVERWIRRESVGGDAAQEFAEVRQAALRLMRPAPPRHVTE